MKCALIFRCCIIFCPFYMKSRRSTEVYLDQMKETATRIWFPPPCSSKLPVWSRASLNNMDSPPQSSLRALTPLIAFFAVLFAALIFWCFISSCLGAPLRRSLSNLWEYTVLGAMSQNTGPNGRRRAPYGEEEIWEMQSRGRLGGRG
ncbi:hypothetical protein BDZ97DRAFT_222086 [Flammula alnicola]|nr:hypothetical protein BDZ97DRAFT_222086 [Flammula alnicola]